MKSWTQTLGLIGGFVILIGGVTFLYQSLNLRTDEDTPTEAAAAKSDENDFHLKFASMDARLPAPMELETTAHADYWFENPQSVPADVTLDYRNCRCTKVELFLLTPEEERSVSKWPPAESPTEPGPAYLNQPGRWQEMDHDGGPTTVPAKARGVFRMTWTNKSAGPQTAKATLGVELHGDSSPRAYPDLVASVLVLPPYEVTPPDLHVGELRRGAVVETEAICWSPTRTTFPLKVHEEVNDPHFECTVRPLSDTELKRLTDQESKRLKFDVTAKGGFLLNVRVREEVQGKHLDMGPFRRHLVLEADPTHRRFVVVTGKVRGEVDVVNGKERGLIDLGEFSADEGITQAVTLETGRADLELELLRWQPSFVQVRMLGKGKALPEGGKRWQLEVSVKPHVLPGSLPEGSEVVLQTNDRPARQLHIPVRGHAYH